MSGPLKQIKHMLLAGDETLPLFRHGGNPLMRWQVDNLGVAMDSAGNVKPDKKESGDKIDGFSAAVDAMAEVMAAKAHIVAPAHRPPRLARTRAATNPLATQHF
jgi:phage terminase large subunit-like protein